MNTASYKLFRVSGGRPFFAEVTVECERGAVEPLVTVSPSAIEGRFDDWRRAAERGVIYALSHAEPRPSLESLGITVTRIRGTDVDTEETAVAAAACHATWLALGVSGIHPPRFEGCSIVFDE